MNSFVTRDFDHSWMIPESSVSAKRIREALAIVDAINEAELLAALPAAAIDRHRHQTAESLLGILEKTLRSALIESPTRAAPCRAANKDGRPE